MLTYTQIASLNACAKLEPHEYADVRWSFRWIFRLSYLVLAVPTVGALAYWGDDLPFVVMVALLMVWGFWLGFYQIYKAAIRVLKLFEDGHPVIQEYVEFRDFAYATDPTWAKKHLE